MKHLKNYYRKKKKSKKKEGRKWEEEERGRERWFSGRKALVGKSTT